MVLYNTKYTALVSTTVFVVTWGIDAAVTLSDPIAVLATTAGYAAVSRSICRGKHSGVKEFENLIITIAHRRTGFVLSPTLQVAKLVFYSDT